MENLDKKEERRERSREKGSKGKTNEARKKGSCVVGLARKERSD
jgi:hypothetical protein